MAVQIVAGCSMRGDRTAHHARSVGDGWWAVSFLPGRTLTTQQAVAALQIAEATVELALLTPFIGLTPMEAVGYALWPSRLRKSQGDTSFRAFEARR